MSNKRNHYSVYEHYDPSERMLQECLGTATAATPLEAVKSVCVEHGMPRGALEGGAFVVRDEDGEDDVLDPHSFIVRELAEVVLVDEDEVYDGIEADELAEAVASERGPKVCLSVGVRDYADGLRLMGEGTFNYGGVPSARIGVYRELPDGHAHGREATVVIPTLGREVIGADTLRELVERRLADLDEEDLAA